MGGRRGVIVGPFCLLTFSRTDTTQLVSGTPHILPGPVEAQEIFVDCTQEASFNELIWYGNSLPFTAFDESRIGCTTKGPSKKEVTISFWGGFSTFL